MPSWDPSPDQLESFYDRQIDRADGETPLTDAPRCTCGTAVRYTVPEAHAPLCPSSPRKPLGATDPREGYDLSDPKGWLL